MRDPDMTAGPDTAPWPRRIARAAALAGLAVIGVLAAAAPAADGRDGPAAVAVPDAYAAEPAPTLQARIAWCESCHGRHGQSPDPDVPMLAGQSAAYLRAQLAAFRTGARADLQMTAIARKLDDAADAALADHFASQARASNHFTPEPGRAAAGAALVERHGCAACHQPGFTGAGTVPRLAGQHPAYLLRQMQAWRAGRRSSPAVDMRAILTPLADDDLDAIAQHLGTLGAPAR